MRAGCFGCTLRDQTDTPLLPLLRSTDCRVVKGAEPSAAPCVSCSPACQCLILLKMFDTSQKGRWTRLRSARSSRRSVVSSLAPHRLPDCQGHRPERSALRAMQLGLRRLGSVEHFRLDLAQKSRLTRLHPARSGRRSVVSLLAPHRLSGCLGRRTKCHTLCVVQF